MRLLLLLILPAVTLNAQINYDSPPWNLSCDTLTTQIELNICSRKETAIADSLMNYFFQKNLNYYETSTLKEAYKKSQNQFINYRKSLCDLEMQKWVGGSILPLMVNLTHLTATIQRIRVLETEYLDNKQKRFSSKTEKR